MVLTARATMPLLQEAGPVVIDFEDLGTQPGMLTVVSNQYADLGVTFNNPEVRNFAADSDDEPPFAHSGSLAAQQCVFEEFCDTPLIVTFSEPQRRVKVWVGLESGVDDAMQVAMTAFDAEAGGDEVASTLATLGPSGNQDLPVQTPLEVTDPGGAIQRVVVGFSPSSEAANNLVFDDVEFEPAPAQVDCPDGTPAPELALDLPADDSDVQIEDFTLQGRVDTSAPLTEATLAVTNTDGSIPVNVLAYLPQEGGAFGPIVVDGALQPGQNTISLTVGNCASANASIEYTPIEDGTEYEQLGLEVTQTIQDTGNSVTLIAGKRTFVRVYLRTFGGTREIRSVSGNLRGCFIDSEQDDAQQEDVQQDDVQQDDVQLDDDQPDDEQPDCFGTSTEFLPALEPMYPITVNDADSLQDQRENLHPPVDDEATKDQDESKDPMVMNFGLLFELPAERTQVGRLRLQLDKKSLSPALECETCDSVTEVEFVEGSPVVVDLVDVTYTSKGEVYEPHEIDHVRLESWLERAYPTNDVTISTVSPLSMGTSVPECHAVNTAMFDAQSAGTIASSSVVPNAHARYYGLVAAPPGPDFEGCAGTDEKRTRISQYAAGLAGVDPVYAWDLDGSNADFYGGHELGHTYLREHPGACGEGDYDEEKPDPIEDGRLTDSEHDYLGFETGVHISGDDRKDIEGIKDISMTIYPGEWTDIMSYCKNRWMSARTYQGILDGMVSERSLQPSLSRSTAPLPGNRVLVISGIIDTLNDSVTLSPFLLLPGDLVSPRPVSSTYNIDLRDGAGGVTTYPFEPWIFRDELPPPVSSPPPPPQFAQLAEVVPWVDGTVSIDIRIGNKVVKTVPVTATPVVTLTSPNGGEPLGGAKFPVTWTASDIDSTDLTYTLLYSADDGVTWQTAAGNIKDKQFLVDPDRLPGSTTARFRVIATDGVSTAQDDSDAPFTVADKAPRVNIDSPGDGATFTSAHTVVLTGAATDIELGELDGPAMTWESNLDGRLGEGSSIGTNLTPGVHTITLTANDGKTPAVSTSISITITDANPPHLVWPDPVPASQLREGQFFYDGAEELGAFYMTDGAGGIQHMRSFDVLLNGWTAIVPGDFGGNEATDLLFYASQAGVGEFFASDGAGDLQLLSGNEGFTQGWDLIVPGNFDDDDWTDLFFYNADAGEGKFYTTDGTGRITLLGEPGTFDGGWTSILAGEFGGDDHTDLLFYNKTTGLAQLFATDGQGGIEVLNDNVEWPAGWDHIVSGNFGGEDGLTDLFLLNADTGNAAVLTADGAGGFVPLGKIEPFSTRWTSIMSGDFGGDRALTDLFFYDAEQGLGRYYLSDGRGGLEQLSSSDAFPTGWDLIVPGYFESS
jgi:hypothetical protein